MTLHRQGADDGRAWCLAVEVAAHHRGLVVCCSVGPCRCGVRERVPTRRADCRGRRRTVRGGRDTLRRSDLSSTRAVIPVFCEEILPGDRRGVISHTEVHVDGTSRARGSGAGDAAHLFLPLLFAHAGRDLPDSRDLLDPPRRALPPFLFPHDGAIERPSDGPGRLLRERFRAHGDACWLFVGVPVPHGTMRDSCPVQRHLTCGGPVAAPSSKSVVSTCAVLARRCDSPVGTRLATAQDGIRLYGWAISVARYRSSCEVGSPTRDSPLSPADLGDARLRTLFLRLEGSRRSTAPAAWRRPPWASSPRGLRTGCPPEPAARARPLGCRVQHDGRLGAGHDGPSWLCCTRAW